MRMTTSGDDRIIQFCLVVTDSWFGPPVFFIALTAVVLYHILYDFYSEGSS